MALITNYLKRKEAEQMMTEKITKFEWQLAGLYAKHPVPMKPVEEIKHSRNRVSLETCTNLMGFLGDNYLQNIAYGDKSFHTSNGALL